MNRKVREQGGICAICHEDFTDYSDIVADHNVPLSISLPSLRHNVAAPIAASNTFCGESCNRRGFRDKG
jgi:hypothetical protein